MKTWQRAPFAVKCGNCGTVLKQGAPMLLIELPGVTRKRRRCKACAGEPVNWDQIAKPEQRQAPELSTFRPVSEIATRFDPKMAQAGKDSE